MLVGPPAFIIEGSGRSGEDELPVFSPSVDLETHLIPNEGNVLPFVDEAGNITFQKEVGSVFR